MSKIIRYYSPSSRGFYSSEIHSRKQMPADARVVAEPQYQALLAAQERGQEIVADAKGNPVGAAPQPTEATRRAQVEDQRQRELNATDSRLIEHMTGERPLSSAQLAGVIGYRKVLRAGGPVLPPKPDFLR